MENENGENNIKWNGSVRAFDVNTPTSERNEQAVATARRRVIENVIFALQRQQWSL